MRFLTKDFTLQKYKELCEAVTKYLTPLTVESYLSKNHNSKFIILRHDVDRKPLNALKIATLENELGISSTYYFRVKEGVFIPEVIKKISKLDHEIGYHYEVLDKAHGNFEKAINIFKAELNEFRKICDVKTICMHGNPLTPWINLDLWKKYDFRDFEIIGEAYISIDYRDVKYFSDTGRRWDSKFSVKDVVDVKGDELKNFKKTDDLIKALTGKEIDRLCLVTHPERWNDKFKDWFRELIFQEIKNFGKLGLKYVRGF